MCGIAGFTGPLDDRKQVLKKMTDIIAHRGPDDEGAFIDENAALGFRRLSIIDLRTGHQPMSNEDDSIWIVFNGEIYNHLDLRKELAAKGHVFKTKTDTEVIIHAYEEYGDDCVKRFNGMFAFAIWDSTRRCLFAARDRVGIKPFYYALIGENFVFGSEIKSILCHPGFKKEINVAALDAFMSFLWTPDPDTIFKNVFKLPPGHRLIVLDNKISVDEYWDVIYEPDHSLSESGWIERIRDQIGTCVNRRLMSDVPLGAFLSGGIDSCAIVSFMNSITKKSVETYTVGFEREDTKNDVVQNDVSFARYARQHLDVDYHEIMLAPDVVNLLPKLVWHMDELVADPAAITTYLVCRESKKTLTVLLSGVGGDEVFAGYPRHLAVKLAEFYNRTPAILREKIFKKIIGLLPGSKVFAFRNAKKFVKSAALPFQERYMGYRTYFTEAEKENMYSREFREATRANDPLREHNGYFEKVKDLDSLCQMLYVDMKTFLPCLNLTYTDKMSMATSVEVRVPFLDHELVETFARMPSEMKLRGFTRKYMFKKSMEGLLPPRIIWRKKAGFGAPIRSWIVGDLREMILDLTSPERLKSRGFFDPVFIRGIVEAEFSGREYNSNHIWQLLVLELWMQEFMDG